MSVSWSRGAMVLLTILIVSAAAHAQLPLPPLTPLPPLPPAPPPPPTPPSPAAMAKLDPLVSKQLEVSGQSYIIVRAPDSGALATATSLITQLGGTLGRTLPI